MEKWKSFLLVALVIGSLFQSYLLAYSKPNFIPIRQTEYIYPELTGTEKEMADFVAPSELILHFGENRHTVLYPRHFFFKEILSKLTKRTFDGFMETSITTNDFRRMRSNRTGLEFIFPNGVPFFLLQHLFQMKGLVNMDFEMVDRIWITSTDVEGEVKAYFFSNFSSIIYEASRVDLTISDLNQYVNFGSYINEQNNETIFQQKLYIPEKPFDMPSFSIHYEMITPEQLQNSLFVDPSISRNLLVRDGTEIFTDGKRGLQINRMKNWISYTDPATTSGQRMNPSDHFQTVIQFVNQHGGWNNEFTIEQFPRTLNQIFIFRQHYGSFPIISDADHPIGYVKVALEEGVVTNYERSLIRFGEEIAGTRKMMSLPAGERLKAMILDVSLPVQRVFPAYRTSVEEDSVRLIPTWAVEVYDGTYQLLK